MKKLVLGISLLVATTTFAQKDELKTLKKMYDKEQMTTEEFAKYKEAITKLESVATTEDDKVAANYYKAMQPLVEMSTLDQTKPDPMKIAKILNPEAFTKIVEAMRSTLDHETKTGKKVFTADINENIEAMKPIFTQMALTFNSAKKYKEASRVFYNTYKMDPKDVSNLENAAITALQASEFADADKYYREIKTLGFKGSGLAKFETTELGVAKVLAGIAFETKNYEQAKKEYAILNKMEPNDIQAQINEATCYYHTNDLATYHKMIAAILAKDPNNAVLQYNVGYLTLADDEKLVTEINANLKNPKKYDELMAKRKAMFTEALPYFEKSYQLNVKDENTKAILRLTYETLGMKDKAASVK